MPGRPDRYKASVSTDAQLLVSLLQDGPQTCKALSISVGRHFTTVWIALTKMHRVGLIEKVKTSRAVYWKLRVYCRDSISAE